MVNRCTVAVLLATVVAGCSRGSTPVLADTAPATDSVSASMAVLSSTVAVESVVDNRPNPVTADRSISEPATIPSGGIDADPEMKMLRRELIIPVSGVVAGELRDTYTEARSPGRLHDAIDIPAPRGTPVLSAGSGRMLKMFTSKAGGLMVYAADSSEGFILMYAHLDGYAPGLGVGSRLARGQTIGFVGTTGNAPPNLPHLHFAIARSADVSKWWQGTPVNPYPLLKTR